MRWWKRRGRKRRWRREKNEEEVEGMKEVEFRGGGREVKAVQGAGRERGMAEEEDYEEKEEVEENEEGRGENGRAGDGKEKESEGVKRNE